MKATNKLAILALLCLPLMTIAGIDTYYVDAENGSDSNDGKSPEKAFQTANKGFSTININDNRGSSLIFYPGEYPLTSGPGVNGGSADNKRSLVSSSTDNPDDVVIYSTGEYECLRLGAYITVSGITFSNGVCKADSAYGASAIRFSNNTFTDIYQQIVTNCVITCCTNKYASGKTGAAVALYGHNLMIDCDIRGNSSGENGAGVLIFNNDGYKGVPRLEGCRIVGNRAGGKGAGVVVANNRIAETYQTTGKSVEIVDCEIFGNTAANGAGILFIATNLVAYLDGCVISNNTVTGNSGGLRLEGGSAADLKNCLVQENRAGSGAGADVIGKSASAVTTFVCSNTVFRKNSANTTGGGMRIINNYGIATCSDTVFCENSAVNSGGGVYISGQGKGFFDNCRFDGNAATGTAISDNRGGGGLFLGDQTSSKKGYCAVSNCVFASNTSGFRAGGMGHTWNTNAFCAAVVNCIFTNNQSRTQGGGLVIRENKANPTPAIVRNCLFAFNETTDTTGDTGGGGLMFATYSDVVLENCTIVSNNIRNTAGYKSGGLHHRWGGGKLKNCIVAFNTVCGEPEDANYWNTDNTLPSANFINCCSDLANNKFLSENGCIIDDPKFVDPANGDFRLQTDSPCVNKGLNADWMTTNEVDPVTGKRKKVLDLAGLPRLSSRINPIVDIGCYEVQIPSGLFLKIQ